MIRSTYCFVASLDTLLFVIEQIKSMAPCALSKINKLRVIIYTAQRCYACAWINFGHYIFESSDLDVSLYRIFQSERDTENRLEAS